jgi:hypothetical protein
MEVVLTLPSDIASSLPKKAVGPLLLVNTFGGTFCTTVMIRNATEST